MDEIVQELKRAPLFAELSDEQIRAVVERLEGRFTTVRKGERVFPLHQHASTFGYLVEGRIEMSRTDPWGNKHVVGIVGPGETIGGVLAFSGMETPPAEAIALTDCRLVVFNRDDFVLDVDDPL
ncbi:MAG: cyclic nucleotide-binding domain-containing protein, partial [Eggerthellaceae bacterium]|nr:cyclic nucleotide-binding domain-containing protein [Eggerthellaceae bacterium]